MQTIKHLLAFLLITLLCSCAEQMAGRQNTVTGTLAGSALGAGLGAIIGNQAGHHAGQGVAIGAAAGALGGGLVGNSLDNSQSQIDAQRATVERQQATIEENQRLIDELRRRGADARSSSRGVVVNLPDVLFRFDRADLTPEARSTVREIADVVKGVSNRSIAIEGHTDSIGTVMYNKRLSEDRARSVENELGVSGVPRERMRSRGFGEGSPIATNNTEEGRARNRRVEVIIEN
jgi:outer membrane protein OmpA-like peptidoglycan-associated protein